MTEYVVKGGETRTQAIDKVKIARAVATCEARFDVYDLTAMIAKTVKFIRQCNDLDAI